MHRFHSRFITIIILVIMLGIGHTGVASAAAATKSMKMVEPKVTLFVGASKALKVKLSNVDAKKIKWQSSNTKVVTVDSKGTIKAVSNGVATITVYLPSTKLKATTAVTVNKKPLNASEVFKKVNPSIVYIETYNKYNEKVASGSGVIVSKDGTVVTNHHVIVDVTEIAYVKVRLHNGQVYETDQVIGFDAIRDLAVLKINGPTNLTPIVIGDSNKIATGEKIFALGSPLGIQNSVTEGIISNKNIVDNKMSFIQFTAPISPGNSGGALVNIYGELIGINVAHYIKGQNMNLAIPVKDYKVLNKTKLMTILEVNQEYYIPVYGEGTSKEAEYNDELDYANEIIYAEGTIEGQLKNKGDMDLFYFLVTDFANVSIFGTSNDPLLGEDFGFSLYDVDGQLVQHGEIYYDEEFARYVCELNAEVPPGYYHIAVYALDGTTLPYYNSKYTLFYVVE
jgi:S1-C subfamily serine protease